MSSPNNDYVELTVSDGTAMRAYVARPQGNGPRPGLMVFQEAFGVNEHIRDVTRRFAAEGYVAIAPELFHRTAPGFEGSYGDFSAVQPHMQALSQDTLTADIKATYDLLINDPGVNRAAIASTGYCLGGSTSYLADAIVPLQASVSYYGGRISETLDKAGDLHAPLLMFWGGLDKHIGPEKIQAAENAVREAGKTYANVVFSDADHGFFCDVRQSYNPRASREAWALTLSFLQDHLG
ncbi:MAG TPA: dienelactone hydrolase family protein [Capsulimonadaceae bacterium]|nr:dienelactone hydrolase family protein [Capsulimonadaceae bacterium]